MQEQRRSQPHLDAVRARVRARRRGYEHACAISKRARIDYQLIGCCTTLKSVSHLDLASWVPGQWRLNDISRASKEADLGELELHGIMITSTTMKQTLILDSANICIRTCDGSDMPQAHAPT